jgi:hypothetical protein
MQVARGVDIHKNISYIVGSEIIAIKWAKYLFVILAKHGNTQHCVVFVYIYIYM